VARLCVRNRFVVLGVWFVITVALVSSSHQLGDNTNDNLSLPGTDSQRATDTLAKSFRRRPTEPVRSSCTPRAAS
jgi:RND superfamily putative drug exporter